MRIPGLVFGLTVALGMSSMPDFAQAGKLSGSWRGGGTMVTGLGVKEAVRCRVKIKQKTSRSLAMTANCAATSGKAKQHITLRSVTKTKYRGSFRNSQHNSEGQVTLTVRGSRRLSMYMVSTQGTASISLRK